MGIRVYALTGLIGHDVLEIEGDRIVFGLGRQSRHFDIRAVGVDLTGSALSRHPGPCKSAFVTALSRQSGWDLNLSRGGVQGAVLNIGDFGEFDIVRRVPKGAVSTEMTRRSINVEGDHFSNSKGVLSWDVLRRQPVAHMRSYGQHRFVGFPNFVYIPIGIGVPGQWKLH